MTKKFIDTQAKIDVIIADAHRAAADALNHDFAWSLDRAESPIEKLFAAQLIHPDTAAQFDSRVELMQPKSGKIEDCEPPPIPGIYVYQQIQVGKYRVDFVLASGRREISPLIVELDGHDFHERTKQQAQRDKSRDRYLVGRGFRFLRFTGSEVHNAPFETAVEALAILLGLSAD